MFWEIKRFKFLDMWWILDIMRLIVEFLGIVEVGNVLDIELLMIIGCKSV